MIPALPAVLVGAQLVIAVAEQVPTLNVNPSCRAAAAGSLGLQQDLEACVKSENHAREQLAAQWREFLPADRTSCLNLTTMGGAGGTYTELLTCLEMKRDARKLPKDTTIGSGMR